MSGIYDDDSRLQQLEITPIGHNVQHSDVNYFEHVIFLVSTQIDFQKIDQNRHVDIHEKILARGISAEYV